MGEEEIFAKAVIHEGNFDFALFILSETFKLLDLEEVFHFVCYLAVVCNSTVYCASTV